MAGPCVCNPFYFLLRFPYEIGFGSLSKKKEQDPFYFFTADQGLCLSDGYCNIKNDRSTSSNLVSVGLHAVPSQTNHDESIQISTFRTKLQDWARRSIFGEKTSSVPSFCQGNNQLASNPIDACLLPSLLRTNHTYSLHLIAASVVR